jgi:prepilin-type N-terminal cleavage/methylation domain-containing protein
MKKGFTLVELLAVIIILGAIFAITFPLVTDNIRKTEEKIEILGIERTFDALEDNEAKESLKIIYRTQAYPSHPIAFSQSIPENIQKKFMEAFINMPKDLLDR